MRISDETARRARERVEGPAEQPALADEPGGSPLAGIG